MRCGTEAPTNRTVSSSHKLSKRPNFCPTPTEFLYISAGFWLSFFLLFWLLRCTSGASGSLRFLGYCFPICFLAWNTSPALPLLLALTGRLRARWYPDDVLYGYSSEVKNYVCRDRLSSIMSILVRPFMMVWTAYVKTVWRWVCNPYMVCVCLIVCLPSMSTGTM